MTDQSGQPRQHLQPHRGVLILVLGILSLVVAGILTGIPAWVMGSGDLKKMAAGTMDPEGRGLTQVGRILGMICTIITAVVLAIVVIALIAASSS